MTSDMFRQIEERARGAGFDLIGLVDAARFDAGQPTELRCARELPGCGTAIVLACGGPGSPQWNAPREIAATLSRAGHRARVAEPMQSRLRFAALAEAAGLGTVSPVIHRLLHPQYGPRVMVGAVVLVEGSPFGTVADASIADRFQPCCHCSRPCLTACPSERSTGHGHVDEQQCTTERKGGGCADACNVVRSCPVGAGQAMPIDVERERHQFELHRALAMQGRGLLPALRRWIGF
jgi:hypothetical protein